MGKKKAGQFIDSVSARKMILASDIVASRVYDVGKIEKICEESRKRNTISKMLLFLANTLNPKGGGDYVQVDLCKEDSGSHSFIIKAYGIPNASILEKGQPPNGGG